jgi:biopolymer transport protein ExbD
MTDFVRRPYPGTTEAAMAEINITPFTDVLLVLLIIFMLLAAMVAPPGFQKSSPNAPGKSRPSPDLRPIVVEITGTAAILVDGQAAQGLGLYAVMAAAVHRHEQNPRLYTRHIEIIGSAGAPYDAIIRVMDAGRQAGDDDVGLVIR